MEEEQNKFRPWDELTHDVLALIFINLSLKELLLVIPCVCKSWRKAVTGPYCWQEIDIELWSERCLEPHRIERMLRMLIIRSGGSPRKLCVSGLRNDTIFAFIAENAGSLKTLRLPKSKLSDSMVVQTIQRLSTITFLDLSHCIKIGAEGLEVIGKHCKLLATLCRNMLPLTLLLDEKPSSDDEANAIAATMPRLKCLEMAYRGISHGSVMKILYGCPELEFLDIRGSHDAKLVSEYRKGKFPKLKLLGPFDYSRNVTKSVEYDMDYFDNFHVYLPRGT